jgi:hypothetical protein
MLTRRGFLIVCRTRRSVSSCEESCIHVIQNRSSMTTHKCWWSKCPDTQWIVYKNHQFKSFVPSRPFGQKTNLLSQHHQGFGITTRGLPRLWWGTSKRTNLGSGDTYRLTSFGHRRRRHTCVLDTIDCLLKFGKVAGRDSCVEKEYILGPRKFEEYKGCRFYNGDCTLVVDVWLHRVDENTSGLTFEEWDPSPDTDTSEAPVTMISRWHVETDVHTVCPSNRFTAWVPGGMYSPWITTMSSGHDVSEYELGASGLPPIFHHNNRGKMFAGLLDNHDRVHNLGLYIIYV